MKKVIGYPHMMKVKNVKMEKIFLGMKCLELSISFGQRNNY